MTGSAGNESAEGGDSEPVTSPQGPPAARPRLTLSASHTLLLQDEVIIRPGLDSVDLLTGGAVGIGGGRTRHQVDGALGLSTRGMGVRLNASWRGASILESRFDDSVGVLRFSPIATFNLRAFSEANRLVSSADWLKATRLSLSLLNVTNQRQRVRDAVGNTPLQYQPGYRDAIGRTVEFEIRRVF